MNCSAGNYIERKNDSFKNMYYMEEEKRGLSSEENHAIAGYYEVEVAPGEEKYITFACSLDEVKIDRKDGVKIIGANSFFEAKMKQIILPRTIEYIDETSFYHCFNLSKIYVQKGKEYEIKKLLPSYWRELVSEI